ncbi:MAG: MFS transporter [Burkholderiales bacterium]|nr:MFS transporter [Burkholderiales bacterium]
MKTYLVNEKIQMKKIMILFAIILACFSVPLNFTAGPTAQPYIAISLPGSAVALAWITNAFFLSCGSTLMVAGVIADQYGRKKVFGVGLLIATVTSLLMPFSPSVLVLDLLRIPQGIAAACAYAGGMSILAQEFEGHARTKIFSVIGITFGAGLAFGPTIAAILITYFSWHAVFFGSTVLSIISLVICLLYMQDSKDPNAKGLDKIGAILFTMMLALFTYAVIEAPVHGWSSPLVITLLLTAAMLLCLFIGVEKRVDNPMLDLSLFAYPAFIGAQLLPLAAAYCYAVLLVILPLRFIGIEHMSALNAGVLMVCFSGSLLFVPFLAASLTRWISVGVLSGGGMVISIIGLMVLNTLSMNVYNWNIKVVLFVIGFGVAIPWGLMDNLAVSVVPKEKAGVAIGIFGALRVSFDSTAIAIVGSLLAFFMSHSLTGIRSGLGTSQIAAATAQIAAGAMGHASQLLPSVPHQELLATYNSAFHQLINVLIIVTSLSTLLIFILLYRTKIGEGLEIATSKKSVKL